MIQGMVVISRLHRWVWRSIFLASFLCGLSGPARAAGNCTPEQKAEADKQLWLNKRDAKQALNFHLPWGVPQSGQTADGERLLVQRDYVINYSDQLLVPLWTAHRIDADELDKVKRIDCFRRDPRVPAPFASLRTDYDEPVFDQGHLTPNGDMSRSLMSVLNSFVLTNMAPQHCFFNRGVWQIFESLVRLWIKDRPIVYVITGSVFDHDGDGKRDEDTAAVRMVSRNGKARVAVPSHFYKILIHQTSDGQVDAVAALLPNNQTDLDGDDAIKYIEKHLVSIQDIQALTGVTFFPEVPSALPPRASALWLTEGSIPHSLASNCRKDPQ